MKNILKISVFFLLFSFIFQVFAGDLKIENKTENSLEFSWEEENKVSYYTINYGIDNLENESETINGTSYTIDNLTPGDYKFVLTGLDEDGKKIFTSKELTVSVGESEQSNFSMKKTELVEEKILRITFSSELDETRLKEFDFKVESSENPNNSLEIINKEIDSKNKKVLELEFEETPISGEEYKVTVFVVFDKNGENLKYGVDSETSFIGGEISKVAKEEKTDLNSAGEEDKTLDNLANEEVKKEEPKKEEVKKEEKTIVGKNVTVNKSVESLSSDKEKLPQTGPEMIFILLLAILLPAGIFGLKIRK